MRKPLVVALAAVAATYLASAVHAEQEQATTTAPAAASTEPAKQHDDCAKKGRTASHKCAHGSAVKGSEHTDTIGHATATQSAGASEPAAKATPAAPATSSKPAASVTYVCPMHPEVTSDKKGRCPKCGMFLEPKK